jgi:hypothetical protein
VAKPKTSKQNFGRSLINTVTTLEQQLNDFDLATRTNALAELVALAERGAVACAPVQDIVNLHCHTCFSFNAYGHSPTSLAWLARKRGFAAVGIVDFDVLDAVDEFLAACDLAGVRGSAGIETRVFIPEFATREINSPGEPGVYYHMGIGFTSGRVPPAAAPTLAEMRARAERRNREMAAKVNAYLDPVIVDYERDVLPLTPAGNATERHMLVAYIRAADREFGAAEDQKAAFWAEKLDASADQITAIIGDYAKFSNLVRGKLMKKGGVGYVQPSPEAFPTVEEFHSFVTACGALPCITWLDGTSAGEQAIDELLDLLIGQGAVALNIIPDRNWNIADPATRQLKVAKLHEIVRIAAERDLPLNVGTEMNAPGNKLVDDFDVPEMAPVKQAFLDGAHCIYGHTAVQRALGLGYQSAWTQAHLSTRRERNDFYTTTGYRVPPGASGLARLRSLVPVRSVGDLLARL